MEFNLFWTIMGILSVVNLLVLLIFFLPVIVFLVTDCIMNKDLGNKVEKHFPKIYRIWERTLMGSLILLLFTFVPFGAHCEIQKSKNEKRVEVIRIENGDSTKVIMESGKIYIIDEN